MKQKYDIIFVVLVYRNTSDLKDFFCSNHVLNSHTIVVNSYFDDETEKVFRNIAVNYGADFITVPNKGYGAGNNAGVNYAIQQFDFKFLVISNADITIKKFEVNNLWKYGDSIIAPKIINNNGKMQNPCAPFKPTKAEAYLAYLLYRGNHNKLIWMIFAFSRLKKILFHILYPLRKKVFSAHGAFVIIPINILKLLAPLYNENMFLFKEEAYLGMLADREGVATIYAPEIVINHKEDGSMKVASINIFKMERQSYIEYYNEWYKNG